MSNVKFSKELLNLVRELTTINTSIIIDKGENNDVFIRRFNPSTTLAYFLSASNNDINFDDNKIAFYNYPEFYQLVSTFENPEIDKDENKLVISSKNSKIKYVLSDPETIKSGPKPNKFEAPNVRLKLSKEDLKELRKMIGLLLSEKANISSKDKEVTIRLFNNSHDNSFERKYEAIESDSDISMNISSDIFTLIPENDYEIEIKKEGIIRFKYVSSLVNLEIFTAEVNE